MSEMSIDDILDSSIDDLADLADFGVYPSGLHRVVINWEKKTVNNKPCMEMKMKLVETVELANPATDQPSNPGTESSVLFFLDNEFGQGALKNVMKVLAGACGTTSIKDTAEASNGMEVSVAIQTKPDKKDPDVKRMNIKKLFV
jgi:hypothetical protein